MTISDLSHEEQVALVALIENIALSNEKVNECESSSIDKIANALGDEIYRNLMAEADERFTDLHSLKIFLETIQNQEVRELIFGTVWEESTADPEITTEESELISWLAKIWNIPNGVNQQ